MTNCTVEVLEQAISTYRTRNDSSFVSCGYVVILLAIYPVYSQTLMNALKVLSPAIKPVSILLAVIGAAV